MKLQQILFRIYVLLTFFLGSVTSIFPIAVLNLLDDFVFLLMVLNLLQVSQPSSKKLAIALVVFCGLFILSAIYAVLNENSISAVILSLRQYKNFFLCFLICSLGKEQFEFVKKVLLFSLIASVPLSIIQFIIADKSNSMFHDEVVGIFGKGQSGTLSLLVLLYVSFEFFKRARDKAKIYGAYLLLLMPCFINETKVIFVLIPIIFTTMFIVTWKTNKSIIFAFIPIFTVILVVANVVYVSMYGITLFEIFGQDYLENYLMVDSTSSVRYLELDIGRFQRISYAYNYIEQQGLGSLLFGEGLGASFFGSASGTYGTAATYFMPLGLNTGSRIQMFHTLIDFGLIGTFIILLFFVLSWFRIAINNNSDGAYFALISCVIILCGFFYQNILTSRIISFLAIYSIYHFFTHEKVQNSSLLGRNQ